MATSKTIETKRMIIAPFSAKYLTAKYVAWLNDPEVVKYSEQRHCRHTMDSCRKYMRSFKGTKNYFWALSSRLKKIDYVGTMTAYVDVNNKVADMGILIGERSIWGQGYGTEAWDAVCNYLFYDVGMRKITAGTLAVNKGMLSIMQRIGMVPDGCRIRQCLFNGKEIDVAYTAIFRNEYEKNHR